MSLPRAVWEKEDEMEYRMIMAEIRAIQRRRRAQKRDWWWAGHRRLMLITALVGLAVASVALGILLKVM